MHPRSVQDTPVPYSAGMLSYASYFRIPPHKKQHYVLNNCCYRGFQPLTSFAVRVHTHTMGRHVFMNRAPHTHKGAQHTHQQQLQLLVQLQHQYQQLQQRGFISNRCVTYKQAM